MGWRLGGRAGRSVSRGTAACSRRHDLRLALATLQHARARGRASLQQRRALLAARVAREAKVVAAQCAKPALALAGRTAPATRYIRHIGKRVYNTPTLPRDLAWLRDARDWFRACYR